MNVLAYGACICIHVPLRVCRSVSVWRPEDHLGCFSFLGAIHPAFLGETFSPGPGDY